MPPFDPARSPMAQAMQKAGFMVPQAQLRLTRGDVVWMSVPQTLASQSSYEAQQSKRRPVVVLDAQVDIPLNAQQACAQRIPFLATDGTSQSWLVEGRPHVALTLPRAAQAKTTYTLLDSVRTVEAEIGDRLDLAYHLSNDEMLALSQGLDRVLRPEQQFFLSRLFRQASLPGQIKRIDAPALKGSGLVLLKRGQFPIFNDGLAHADTDIDGAHLKDVPCLVAMFPQQFDQRTLRGLKWADLKLVAVHERFLREKQGVFTDNTVGIMLNTLRRAVGVPPIPYVLPSIKHRNTIFWDIARLFMPWRSGPGAHS